MTKPQRMSQADKALLGLRSLVLKGAFGANERLPEVALSERLGVSRTPLRQAMDRLVAEGLLDRIETGGCRVARFTSDDIADAIEIRGVIEGTAARLAAERGPVPAELVRAERAIADIDEAIGPDGSVDFDAYVQGNAAFHDSLARLAGSSVVQRELERVNRLPLASPSAFLKDQAVFQDFLGSLVHAQAQHKALIEAIRAREGTRAEAIAREHARLARRNLDHLSKAGPTIAERVPGLSLVTPTA